MYTLTLRVYPHMGGVCTAPRGVYTPSHVGVHIQALQVQSPDRAVEKNTSH